MTRKKTNIATTIARAGRFGLRAIVRALEIARSNITERLKKMKNKIIRYNQQEDNELLPYIKDDIHYLRTLHFLA